jgi:dihydroorotate dehydrogenase electron transfer subunit
VYGGDQGDHFQKETDEQGRGEYLYMKLGILNNVFIKERRLLLELSAPVSFKSALPGQFIHVRIEDSYDPILRRPFSIYDVCESRKKNRLALRVLYEVVGKGTELLSQKKPLSEIDILGPLGNGFDLDKLCLAKKIYIVAGGIGVAPLFFLARKLTDPAGRRGPRTKSPGPIVLIGAKTENDILREKEFKDLGCEVYVATEDGSKGFKGRVTELLNSLLSCRPVASPRGEQAGTRSAHEQSVICACGPKPMLAAISGIAQKCNVPAQVSLEEFMGCGLGACLGCVIRTASGYERICHDGPVFDSSEIIWKE